MKANRDKFQSIILSSLKDLSKSILNINGIELIKETFCENVRYRN